MHPVAPAVDEFPAAPVQLLHGAERIPLYELLMDIFERGFHLLSECSDKLFYPQFFIIRTFPENAVIMRMIR